MVSEFILQQTRVAQAIEYYENFISTFPTIFDLALAPIDKVMKAWQGLGYYTRARNLHAAAKQIVADFGGEIPNTFDKLLTVKGLGQYSAAAVASFAFGQAVPAVDGNGYRILTRLFGIFASIDTAKGKKQLFDLANELMDPKQPALFNQGIIDFGAMVCTFRQPKCTQCIFARQCYAHANNLADKLPVRGKRNAPRNRYFAYLMILHKGYTFIKRREEHDIWQLLYEFPMIETPVPVDISKLQQTEQWMQLVGTGTTEILSVSEPVKHQLSHQTIFATFVIVETNNMSYQLKTNFQKVKLEQIDNYSVPQLINNYLAAEPTVNYIKNRKNH